MVVVLLVVLAAALSAVSAAGEHRAAFGLRRRRGQQHRPAALQATGFAVALVTTPLWVGSWAVDIGAFFIQATALHLGQLSVVQPLMVTTLLFTLPLAAAESGRWPSVRDWVGAVVLSVGLALLLSTRGPVEELQATPSGLLIPALAAVTAVVVALVLISRGRSASVRAALLGAAAGMLFGVGAATTKLAAGAAATAGLTGLVTSWAAYALAAASVASFAMQQSAYAIGPLATVMTAVITVNPLVSYLLGVVGFGERLPAAGTPLVLGAAGMAGLVVGVLVLARSPLLRRVPVPEGPAAGSAAASPRRDKAPRMLLDRRPPV
jgi:drug/metabolite transporter (DMT)-like permease